ncbi:hypothetical protein ILYODFUR_022110 [Ilyodon furcidens]|uniref:Uncharacterized protein n=1 Tax=Ilyodon furcidens TaxID=33524 RepID=A0ABV0TML8_9TELE
MTDTNKANPPVFLIHASGQRGRQTPADRNKCPLCRLFAPWMVGVERAVFLTAEGLWVCGRTMCTTIMVLSTLAFFLRQHLFSRGKT